MSQKLEKTTRRNYQICFIHIQIYRIKLIEINVRWRNVTGDLQ